MRKKLAVVLMLAAFLGGCKPDKSFKPEDISFIPKPEYFQLNDGSFEVNGSTQLVVNQDKQQKAADYLANLMEEGAGIRLAQTGEEVQENSIEFVASPELIEEAYELKVTPEKITIKASSGAGYFYGIQTIRQLLPDAIESQTTKNSRWLIPSVVVKDEPRFEWRGMHMDFSRHFFTLEEVKKFLDYMALYKLNSYHMHLTDDQGWRIEIKEYPKLTQNGAWRKHNNQDSICLKRAETNPLFEIPEKNYKTIDGQRKYGGYFSQEQISEIINYANDRFITVIPEIDMPGHFKAAIDNYPYLSCSGEPGWGETFSIPACPGKESTYEFVKNILSEVSSLFPAQYIHIGGDEVNYKPWEECPHCQQTMREQGLENERELQSFFNQRIEEFLNNKGKQLMGWDEIVEDNLSSDAAIMWWRNWAPRAPYIAADKGYDIVFTPDFQYYFDFTYQATPLKKVYQYQPVPEDFTSRQKKQILGVQANLWSEWIPNFRRLQYQAFPRMLALAEAGWTSRKLRDFQEFEQRVYGQYDRMDALNIYFHLPDLKGLDEPVAFLQKDTVKIGVPLESMEVYYTLDGSEPTRQSERYTGPFEVSQDGLLKARAFRGDIAGRTHTTEIDKLHFKEGEKVGSLKEGVNRRFVADKFDVVDNVEISDAVSPKIVQSIDMGEYEDRSHYSMKFTGYFHATRKGIYKFSVNSDDGSLLYLGDELIVDNGGNHAARLKTGVVALKPGYHPVTLLFHQAGGGGNLEAYFTEPGGTREHLSNKMFVKQE